MPWGPIKVSDYSPFGGGGEEEGLQLLLELLRLVVLTLTGGGLLPQDLKEKKLVEEKENGKDAINGKVGALPSASTPHARPPLTHALPGKRRERRTGC